MYEQKKQINAITWKKNIKNNNYGFKCVFFNH